jgi:hypothetical protein
MTDEQKILDDLLVHYREQLAKLNRNLERLKFDPLFDDDAASALELDDLRQAVDITGRYLVKCGRHVREET